MNANEPDFKGLPEPEIADMERVLDEIEVLLPILGFDVQTPPMHDVNLRQSLPVTAATGNHEASPNFVMDCQKAKGKAVERSGEFVVLAGSTALRRETSGIPQSTFARRRALVDAGVLVPDNDPELYVFAQDASFGSASGASTVIAGRSDNGRTSWRVEGRGASYAHWRAEQLTGDPIAN